MRTIALRGLVRRLLIHEADGSTDPISLIGAAGQVASKLRTHLTRRIGQEGYQTLLSRSLTLTRLQFPELDLAAFKVEADGTLGGVNETDIANDKDGTLDNASANSIECTSAVLGQLLQLLTTFIGDDLALRILRSIWTDFNFDDPSIWENEKP